MRPEVPAHRLRPDRIQLCPQYFPRSFDAFGHLLARHENSFLLRLQTTSAHHFRLPVPLIRLAPCCCALVGADSRLALAKSSCVCFASSARCATSR
eukprot:6183266-Pleurochrysis_carterae.AAC.2